MIAFQKLNFLEASMKLHSALLVAFVLTSAFFTEACLSPKVRGGAGWDEGGGGNGNGGEGGAIENGGAGGQGGAGGGGGAPPSSGRLVAFGWDPVASVWSSVHIDVSTGTLESLLTLPSQYDSFGQGIGTYEHVTNQIFELTGNNTLIGIDAATGALNSVVPLTLNNYSGVNNLEVNIGGDVIGFAWNPTAAHFDVVQIDVLTGALDSLAALPVQYDSMAQGTGAFDPLSNQIFEIASNNTLLVVDAVSGALNKAVPIVLNGYSDVVNLEVNNAGELIGFTWDPNALEFKVVRIDTVSGALVPLASLPKQYGGLAQGTGAFDPYANRIFEMADNNMLLTIDAASGALLDATPLVLGGYSGITNMEYVP
jgi:hypothetical protein